MGFYKEGMRIKPHPDVPGVYGRIVKADDETFDIEWDDGDVDSGNPQTNDEQRDLQVDNG
jgi:hypothetical protein